MIIEALSMVYYVGLYNKFRWLQLELLKQQLRDRLNIISSFGNCNELNFKFLLLSDHVFSFMTIDFVFIVWSLFLTYNSFY